MMPSEPEFAATSNPYLNRPWLRSYPTTIKAEIGPAPYATLTEMFLARVQTTPNAPALNNLDHTLTYQEWHDAAAHFAKFLQQDLQLSVGSRVGIMLPNVLQFPVCMFGALMAGMIIVNINPLYTARELAHQLNDSGCELIIVLANMACVVQDAIQHAPVKHIVVTEVADLLPFVKRMSINFIVRHIKKMIPSYHLPQAYSLQEIYSRKYTSPHQLIQAKSSDIAVIQYTGGTTGLAKGAVLTHANLTANTWQSYCWIESVIQSPTQINIISALPLYHIFSFSTNMLVSIFKGSLNILITNPRDIKTCLKTLKKYPPSCMSGVNTLFAGMLRHPLFDQVDWSHLLAVIGGGMALQRSVADQWFQRTGCTITEGYGLSETCPTVCCNPPSKIPYTSYIGIPMNDTYIEVVDAQDKPLPLGEVGELCIKGPQVFQGYWNKPEETAKAFTADGWFKTGDLGFMDLRGYITLVDRKKDLIIVSGFNVYPNEVEAVISDLPDVLEVGVVGIPDEKTGEAVCAHIVKKLDSPLSASQIIDHCKTQLARYKVPRKICFHDILPKSNVGKILRKDLR